MKYWAVSVVGIGYFILTQDNIFDAPSLKEKNTDDLEKIYYKNIENVHRYVKQMKPFIKRWSKKQNIWGY